MVGTGRKEGRKSSYMSAGGEVESKKNKKVH
jgi:hypothetical protein